MRTCFKYIVFGLLVLNSIFVNAQLWPFSPMLRFGNTVYYKLDSLKTSNLTGTSLMAFDKQLTRRYFDIISKGNNIGLSFSDSIIIFKQNERKEPKCYKEILFYSRRVLKSTNVKVKYLKFLDINDTCIIAQATLKRKTNSNKYKRHETVSISKKDIVGVFLGEGRNERVFVAGLASCAVIITLILDNN